MIFELNNTWLYMQWTNEWLYVLCTNGIIQITTMLVYYLPFLDFMHYHLHGFGRCLYHGLWVTSNGAGRAEACPTSTMIKRTKAKMIWLRVRAPADFLDWVVKCMLNLIYKKFPEKCLFKDFFKIYCLWSAASKDWIMLNRKLFF